MPNPLFGRDIVSIRDFRRSELETIFQATTKISNMPYKERRQLAEGRLLGLIFYEPSSRTKLSFESAMYSIGGSSIGIADPSTSSVEKGENFTDTVIVVSGYVDVLVIRHSREGAARYAASISEKPVINAGSGAEEHPTQAMLDLYTIHREKGRIDGLTVGIMGDLRYSRTVYSLLYALSKYDTKIRLISPPELRLRSDALLDIRKDSWTQHTSIDEVISELDVLYVTRIQKERFPDPTEYQRVKGSYYVDTSILERGKSELIVLHPLPRVDEIKPEVDRLPQAKYFLQAKLGKDLRAALLALILNPDFE
ncbi:MAG: aspartate carbamoyltransferase [Nitrososphaerales archaeon]